MNDKLFSTALLGEDADFLQEVTGLFMAHIPILSENITNGIKTRNWAEVYFSAHKMKASIDLFEVDSLKEIIRKTETFAKEEINLDELPALAEQINEIVLACITQMKKDFMH